MDGVMTLNNPVMSVYAALRSYFSADPKNPKKIDSPVSALVEQVSNPASKYDFVRLVMRGTTAYINQIREKKTGNMLIAKVAPGPKAHESSAEDLRQERAASDIASLTREAEVLSQMTSAHAPRMYDSFSIGLENTVVMENVQGKTLAEKLAEGPVPERDLIKYSIQVLCALSELHGLGYAHRNISPKNIIIDTQGNAKLLDYGSAEKLGDKHSSSRSGSRGFAPLEQMIGSNKVDPRNDVFALGVTIQVAASGMLPPNNLVGVWNMPSARKYCHCISDEFAKIIDKSRASNIKDRYASAAELRTALEALQSRSLLSAAYSTSASYRRAA